MSIPIIRTLREGESVWKNAHGAINQKEINIISEQVFVRLAIKRTKNSLKWALIMRSYFDV